MIYDAIIIGGGPAGMAAAVYLARQKLSFLILTGNVGGQTLWSSDVENYLGFHLLDGVDLVKRFREHLKDYRQQFELKEQELVTQIEKIEQRFRLTTARGIYDTRTILVATGAKHRELGVPGERALFGKGVTYCAACDAPLFAGKRVCIVGGGNSAMDAALFTEKYAKSVLLVSINTELQGDVVMQKKIQTSQRIRVLTSTRTEAIVGKDHVEGVQLVGKKGGVVTESVEGVFIEIGLEPVSQFVDWVMKDRWGQIVVDKHNATTVEGIWAAGDVTDITEKQISVAVGEGSKAGLSIIHYLQTHHT